MGGGRRRPGRAVTMNDVAAAGVAQSTVSRILNDTPAPIPVSPETRERVLKIARELGYRPHPIARALRGAPTMLLGAIVRDITDPFFAGAVEALVLEAKAHGYSVVLGHARAAEDEALALTAVLEARQCDGIVLLGDFRAEQRLVEDLSSGHAHVVGLWHGTSRDHPFPTVGVDNRAGVRAALAHLRGLGHERIAFVGAESLGDQHDRLAAYQESMDEHGGMPSSCFLQRVSNTIEAGSGALALLLEAEPRPTAVLAATDALALGLLHGAYQLGVRVPDELSVVGFDDIPWSSASVPPLTTVKMPIAEIIATGVALCVGEGAWDGEGAPPQQVFQPQLIERLSTARAEQAALSG